MVGAVQSLQQALDAAAGAHVEGLAVYSWEPEWVEELAKPHPLPPEKQVRVQGKVQVLAQAWELAGHQPPPPKEQIRVQEWTECQLPLPWEPVWVQEPAGHRPPSRKDLVEAQRWTGLTVGAGNNGHQLPPPEELVWMRGHTGP